MLGHRRLVISRPGLLEICIRSLAAAPLPARKSCRMCSMSACCCPRRSRTHALLAEAKGCLLCRGYRRTAHAGTRSLAILRRIGTCLLWIGWLAALPCTSTTSWWVSYFCVFYFFCLYIFVAAPSTPLLSWLLARSVATVLFQRPIQFYSAQVSDMSNATTAGFFTDPLFMAFTACVMDRVLPTDADTFPQEYLIDWVRVYQWVE